MELLSIAPDTVFYGDGSEKNNIRNWINEHLRRITELLAADGQTKRPKRVDPTKFS